LEAARESRICDVHFKPPDTVRAPLQRSSFLFEREILIARPRPQ